jgi:mannosyltransferase
MLTSRREPFGRTAVEAMAAGVPLVAARSGAFPEILKDGTSAALVEDMGDLAVDAEALVTAVGTLISEPDRLRGLSEGARLAASDFDVSHTAEALAALL